MADDLDKIIDDFMDAFHCFNLIGYELSKNFQDLCQSLYELIIFRGSAFYYNNYDTLIHLKCILGDLKPTIENFKNNYNTKMRNASEQNKKKYDLLLAKILSLLRQCEEIYKQLRDSK